MASLHSHSVNGSKKPGQEGIFPINVTQTVQLMALYPLQPGQSGNRKALSFTCITMSTVYYLQLISPM